jgi:hypothetical protein
MADRLPIEHYIEEFFVKCAQVVLGARIFQPDQSRPAPDKRSARWVRKKHVAVPNKPLASRRVTHGLVSFTIQQC